MSPLSFSFSFPLCHLESWLPKTGHHVRELFWEEIGGKIKLYFHRLIFDLMMWRYIYFLFNLFFLSFKLQHVRDISRSIIIEVSSNIVYFYFFAIVLYGGVFILILFFFFSFIPHRHSVTRDECLVSPIAVDSAVVQRKRAATIYYIHEPKSENWGMKCRRIRV